MVPRIVGLVLAGALGPQRAVCSTIGRLRHQLPEAGVMQVRTMLEHEPRQDRTGWPHPVAWGEQPVDKVLA